jgi:hypothetical protein
MMTSPLILSIILFLISWIEWYIYGKKGVALLNRSPWLIFWACLEVFMAAIAGYGFYDAYASKNIWFASAIILATVLGCAIGCATSGVVEWKKNGKS